MTINGGFPPIRYSKEEMEKKSHIAEGDKERAFATTYSKQLDIRNILTTKKTPIINLEKKDIEVIDSL